MRRWKAGWCNSSSASNCNLLHSSAPFCRYLRCLPIPKHGTTQSKIHKFFNDQSSFAGRGLSVHSIQSISKHQLVWCFHNTYTKDIVCNVQWPPAKLQVAIRPFTSRIDKTSDIIIKTQACTALACPVTVYALSPAVL